MDNLFFIGSKLAWGLLSPANGLVWLLVIATICLICKKFRLALWLMLINSVFALALTLYPLGDCLIYPLEQRFSRPLSMPAKIDGIIVLGGDEKLKISIARQHAEIGEDADRIIAAAVLARQYSNAPVIFSGGSGSLQFQQPAQQGWVAKQLLADVGIAPQRLITESRSRNTNENFILMKSILPKPNGLYLLVTSAYHMPRAVGIARQQNIHVIAYPVDYRSNPPEYRSWDVDLLGHLRVLEPAWHEWIGLTVYFFTGKIAHWLPPAESGAESS